MNLFCYLNKILFFILMKIWDGNLLFVMKILQRKYFSVLEKKKRKKDES